MWWGRKEMHKTPRQSQRLKKQSFSFYSLCTLRTWRLVVAGLLDNLKWNNSVRRAQTYVGGCVRQPRVWGLKVFLTNGNVNSPSRVHINFLPGGRRKRAERWHREERMGCNDKVTENVPLYRNPLSVTFFYCFISRKTLQHIMLLIFKSKGNG